MQENYVKLQRDAEANIVLLLAVREQLTVREGELAQSQQELAEQKGRCSSMEISMNAEAASRERTQRELRTAYLQRDAVQGQLDRCHPAPQSSSNTLALWAVYCCPMHRRHMPGCDRQSSETNITTGNRRQLLAGGSVERQQEQKAKQGWLTFY